jgi:hypothetical protein
MAIQNNAPPVPFKPSCSPIIDSLSSIDNPTRDRLPAELEARLQTHQENETGTTVLYCTGSNAAVDR